VVAGRSQESSQNKRFSGGINAELDLSPESQGLSKPG